MKAAPIIFYFFLSFSLQAMECDFKSPLKSYWPKHAKHFSIDYYKDFKIVHVDKDQYLLSTYPTLECTTSMTKITTPVKRSVMMSTTYLPALELLGVQKSLIGFQGKEYIVSTAFDVKNIQEVSYKLNAEALLKLKADLVMGYESNLSTPAQRQIFSALKIPFVVNKDFEEVSPLARAEWLVLISSFYNLEAEAIGLFEMIRTNYLSLMKKNSRLKDKPRVLVGDIQNGFWMTSGGKSDLAQMIADAGAELVMASTSSATQKISLEKLTTLAMPVDYWLTHNMWSNKAEFLKATNKDSRYKLITAKNIYNNNLIQNKNKFNDYWESGMQRPDLMLQDLSFLFHPEDNKGHVLKWYHKL